MSRFSGHHPSSAAGIRWVSRLVVLAAASTPIVSVAASDSDAIEEIVVTGTRIPTAVDRLPSASTVITTEEIQTRQSASVIDLLRDTEGVHVSQPGGRGGVPSLFLRGAEPNFVVVLIDGVRVNDPNNTRGGSYDFSTVTTGEIERVEIVQGPQSSVYGSDALAGVVNLITRPASSEALRNIQLAAGQDGLERGQFAARGPLGSAVTYSMGIAHDNDGHPVEGSGYRSDTAWLSLNGTVGSATHVAAAWRFAQTDTQSYPEDSGGPDLAVIPESDRARNDETTVGGEIEQTWNDRWLSRITLNYYSREDDIHSPGVAPGVLDGVPPNQSDSTLDRTVGQVLTQYSAGALRMAIGADVRDENGKSDGSIEFAPGFDVPTAYRIDRRNVGAFAEGDYQYNDALLLRASARIDNPDDANNVTSPQFGAIVTLPDDRTRLHINWGEGFKLPSFFALAHPLVGDPNLKPENANGVDVGLVRDFDANVSLQAFAFHSEYDNLIDFDPQTFTTVNRAKVTIDGFDAAARWMPTDSTAISSEVTRTKIDVKPDGKLRQRPNWRGSVGVRQRLTANTYINANLLFVDRVYDSSIPTGPVHLDSYTRLDVTLGWHISNSILATLAVDDALNDHYEEAVGFPSPDRRARMILSFDF